MAKIERNSLMTLEAYSRERSRIRASVILHKKNRKISLGANLTLIFEDETTIRYQIHEMLRVERIFEELEILAELNAYNPLVPDGTNLKATMMLEYPDPSDRADALSRLMGIEDKVWLTVDGFARVWAIADEDLDRASEKKTSAVHFLRFELTSEMVSAFRSGREVEMGVEHAQYSESVLLTADSRSALAMDFS
jgi:hypothetical protein